MEQTNLISFSYASPDFDLAAYDRAELAKLPWDSRTSLQTGVKAYFEACDRAARFDAAMTKYLPLFAATFGKKVTVRVVFDDGTICESREAQPVATYKYPARIVLYLGNTNHELLSETSVYGDIREFDAFLLGAEIGAKPK